MPSASSSIAASGVLAQFGGVMLAFAFLATFGFNGLVTMALRDTVGIDLTEDSTWLYGMTGLTLVYTYFQIPLMVIVFLPALDGLRQEWYDASASLGGSSWIVLAARRRSDPRPELPRRGPAPVRERVLGLRDRRGPGEPGQPDRAAPDP